MKCFDKVFITHLPSFYKVNLYQALARHSSICVIFIAQGSIERSSDFLSQMEGVPHYILNEGAFEKRWPILSCIKLLKVILKIQSKKWIVGGWDLLEFWLVALTFSKGKNAVVVESTYLPCTWWKRQLKKRFIKKMSQVYVCGSAQESLVKKLGFSGVITFTGGVGLVDWQSLSLFRKTARSFVYVGRLSPEKNIPLLLSAFRQCPDIHLTLIGSGPMAPALKTNPPSNLHFIDHVPHEQLPRVLTQYDVLILPSYQEAWGIVVEEAQICGLPVIVSSAVGCCSERVTEFGGGMVFETGSEQSLLEVLSRVRNPDVYRGLLKNVSAIKFNKIREKQIQSYLEEYEDTACS
jgi:glycosyltransferase involved in cell wall biosynthesis